jgi:hypothetical protein
MPVNYSVAILLQWGIENLRMVLPSPSRIIRRNTVVVTIPSGWSVNSFFSTKIYITVSKSPFSINDYANKIKAHSNISSVFMKNNSILPPPIASIHERLGYCFQNKNHKILIVPSINQEPGVGRCDPTLSLQSRGHRHTLGRACGPVNMMTPSPSQVLSVECGELSPCWIFDVLNY